MKKKSSGIDVIGKNLKLFRNLRAISQDELSERSKVSRVRISDLENGKASNVSYSTLEMLAGALDITPEKLIKPVKII